MAQGCSASWARLTLGALVLVSLRPASASAFCRESVVAQGQGPCVEEPGVPLLFWSAPRNCLTYRFNEQFWVRVPLLSEKEIRQAFSGAFRAWASISCADRRDMAFLVEQFRGTTPTSAAEFLYDAANESVIAARTRAEWQALEDHSANAVALTLVWHDKSTGEILDVDMELNTGAGSFNDCQKQSCSAGMLDLQNTVTHEAGHLLGLGHSTVAGSTMQATTSDKPETTKRTLEADDQAGYCSLDLPGFRCRGNDCTCPEPPTFSSRAQPETSGGCHTLGASGGSGAGAVTMLALLVMLCRRRQRV